MAEVADKPLTPEQMGRVVIHATIDDALHFTAKEREEQMTRYPAHQRKARLYGIPMMGEGQIYPIEEDSLKVPVMAIPDHWPRICGLDFGSTHPTAAAWLAWDREVDTVYLYDVYRAPGGNNMLPVHASAIKARGDWIPVAWPHDGDNNTAAGEALKTQYKAQGVNMLPKRAEFAEGGNWVEPGIQAIYDRMVVGTFRVFSHLNPFFEEMRLYHRKDGKIVKINDDVLDAVRVAHMMLRKAKTRPTPVTHSIGRYVPRDAETGI